jgi:hypothetical protein
MKLRLLTEGDVQRAIEKAKEALLFLGTDLDYAVGAHEPALLAAAKDRGIAITVYMVDPTSQLVQDFYGEEGVRGRVRDNPAGTFAKNRQVQDALRRMHKDLSEAKKWDRLKVYLYKHVTLYTAIAVDANTSSGSLIVSPHLYSVDAKYPPLVELTKKDHAALFDLYWADLQRFIERVERRPLAP